MKKALGLLVGGLVLASVVSAPVFARSGYLMYADIIGTGSDVSIGWYNDTWQYVLTPSYTSQKSSAGVTTTSAGLELDILNKVIDMGQTAVFAGGQIRYRSTSTNTTWEFDVNSAIEYALTNNLFVKTETTWLSYLTRSDSSNRIILFDDTTLGLMWKM